MEIKSLSNSSLTDLVFKIKRTYIVYSYPWWPKLEKETREINCSRDAFYLSIFEKSGPKKKKKRKCEINNPCDCASKHPVHVRYQAVSNAWWRNGATGFFCRQMESFCCQSWRACVPSCFVHVRVKCFPLKLKSRANIRIRLLVRW